MMLKLGKWMNKSTFQMWKKRMSKLKKEMIRKNRKVRKNRRLKIMEPSSLRVWYT